jgi:hypothetical protein
MDKYFDYEDIEEENMVKHEVKRLKGHATLWWDELQADHRCKGKQKIKSRQNLSQTTIKSIYSEDCKIRDRKYYQ